MIWSTKLLIWWRSFLINFRKSLMELDPMFLSTFFWSRGNSKLILFFFFLYFLGMYSSTFKFIVSLLFLFFLILLFFLIFSLLFNAGTFFYSFSEQASSFFGGTEGIISLTFGSWEGWGASWSQLVIGAE